MCLGRVDGNGNFRVAAMPGPGVLMAIDARGRTEAGSVFRQATVSQDDAPYIKPKQGAVSRSFAIARGGNVSLENANALKYVNFSQGCRTAKRSIP